MAETMIVAASLDYFIRHSCANITDFVGFTYLLKGGEVCFVMQQVGYLIEKVENLKFPKNNDQGDTRYH